MAYTAGATNDSWKPLRIEGVAVCEFQDEKDIVGLSNPLDHRAEGSGCVADWEYL